MPGRTLSSDGNETRPAAETWTEPPLLKAPESGRIKVVLDTDAFNEIDDQFAIVQMLLSEDRFDIQAIYAAPFLNARSESAADGMLKSYDEILRILGHMNRDAAGLAHKGVGAFVGSEKVAREADAVDHLIETARSCTPEEPLYVIAIAAISNVSSAILKAPDILDRIVVVWLGGNAMEWPDTLEFNLKQDIGGAQVLFDSGAAVVMLPCMGVVSHLHSTVPEIRTYVEPHGAVGAFLAERFCDYSDDHIGWSKPIWDMAAVGWLLNPEWGKSYLIPSPVVTELGTWSIDRTRHPVRYVYQIHRDPILRDFFDKLRAFAKGQV